MTLPREGRVLLTWLLFGGLAVLLCMHLGVHWTENQQYSFGLLVPVLAAYALYRRWTIRPAPGALSAPGWQWLIAPLAFLFLPLWLVAQPSPDWRLISWLLTADLVGLGLLAWAAAGGIPWLRHFAFPTCFIATAVPWPGALEVPVIQGLMHFVAGLTVAVLNPVGIPALQHGSVIETGAGLLGIDEACSGVRSLQATLMFALFLGEFYWVTWPRRRWLLGAGLVVAIATNSVRAFFLAWHASQHGVEAVERWHDPAGFSVMTACFLALWSVALLTGAGRAEPEPTSEVPAARILPVPALLTLIAWFALALIGTEAWFRSSGQPPGKQWTFRWPKEQDAFEKVRIMPETAAQLRFDYGEGASWNDSTGVQWLAYNFRWVAGPSRSRLLARMHRPENCLPAAGWQLTRDDGELLLQVGGLSIPFQALTFEHGPQVARIWFCTWEDLPYGAEQSGGRNKTALRGSVDAIVQRRRNVGQQVLEVVRFGRIPPNEADGAFLQEIAPRLEPTGAR